MPWPLYALIFIIFSVVVYILFRKLNKKSVDNHIMKIRKNKKQRISGIQRTYKHIIFTYFKEHNCPNCNNLLRRIKVSKVVNSKSPEAIHYDFSGIDYSMRGNVKFIWDEFICDVCGYQAKPKKLKQIEEYKN